MTLMEVMRDMVYPVFFLALGVSAAGFFAGVRSGMKAAPELPDSIPPQPEAAPAESKPADVLTAPAIAATGQPEALNAQQELPAPEVKVLVPLSKAEVMANARAFLRGDLKPSTPDLPYGEAQYTHEQQLRLYQKHMMARFNGADDATADMYCLCPVCATRRQDPQCVRVNNVMNGFAMDRDLVKDPEALQDAGGADLKMPATPVWINRGRVLMSDDWPPVIQ